MNNIISIIILLISLLAFLFILKRAKKIAEKNKTESLNQSQKPLVMFSSIEHANKAIKKVALAFIIICTITLIAAYFLKEKYNIEAWSLVIIGFTFLISIGLLLPLNKNLKFVFSLILLIGSIANFIMKLPTILQGQGIGIIYLAFIPLLFCTIAYRSVSAAWYLKKQDNSII